ncbi:helix-turn-helix domain-containing protein [Citrobacter sp. Cpo100]|uniref:helix-turn-helix domain-containing protein n=1 Tax=Citrobacter sp. Cpo100 TaxID=2985141 RepID=UPI002578B5EC|nr:helix-turn-helix transcriptional regulator [Citrobacter sp. Cpo100]MDM2823171.1 helix-turn-helix domain-containing protein [Citrobacter sp. Cpo100]
MLTILLDAMNQKGITGYKLAKLTGIQHGTIYRIMNGKECLGVKMLEKLTNAMGYEMVITLKDTE